MLHHQTNNQGDEIFQLIKTGPHTTLWKRGKSGPTLLKQYDSLEKDAEHKMPTAQSFVKAQSGAISLRRDQMTVIDMFTEMFTLFPSEELQTPMSDVQNIV